MKTLTLEWPDRYILYSLKETDTGFNVLLSSRSPRFGHEIVQAGSGPTAQAALDQAHAALQKYLTEWQQPVQIDLDLSDF